MITRPEIMEGIRRAYPAHRRAGKPEYIRSGAGACPAFHRTDGSMSESVRQCPRRLLFSLCDIAAGMSTYACEVTNVTQCAGINFVRGVNSGTIYVESNIVHKGRHTAVCRVDITGEEEELLATGNFTMFLGKEI